MSFETYVNALKRTDLTNFSSLLMSIYASLYRYSDTVMQKKLSSLSTKFNGKAVVSKIMFKLPFDGEEQFIVTCKINIQ